VIRLCCQPEPRFTLSKIAPDVKKNQKNTLLGGRPAARKNQKNVIFYMTVVDEMAVVAVRRIRTPSHNENFTFLTMYRASLILGSVAWGANR